MLKYNTYRPWIYQYNLTIKLVNNWKKQKGRLFLKSGVTLACFHIIGKTDSVNKRLNNRKIGLTMVNLVAFNILWQIRCAPMALFTERINYISMISCSLIHILSNIQWHINISWGNTELSSSRSTVPIIYN